MAQAITCYPVYENDQYSKLSPYVYVADWNKLAKSSDLKGYKIINKGTHYYNLQYEMLVDFDYQMEVEEAGIRALRGLAEDLLNDNELNLGHVLKGKTKSRKLK